MTRQELNQLFEKISIHRPNFDSLIDTKMTEEWLSILKDYDYMRIEDNLYQFLRLDNNNAFPSVFSLVKATPKLNEQYDNLKGKMQCHLCKRYMTLSEYQEHFSRCSSINYIESLYQRVFHKQLSGKYELYQMDYETFHKKYMEVLERAYELLPDGLEKRGISNSIESYYGRPIKYAVNGKELNYE